MSTEVDSHQHGRVERPLVDKAFFGKDTCLTVQLQTGACYMSWGKKQGENWDWKRVKFNDLELGEMLLVAEGKQEKCSFYHSFDNKATKIHFGRDEKGLLCNAEGYGKRLNHAEQRVLAVLLQNMIWMMHVRGI